MTVLELLQRGGWLMAPIYLCSIAALAVFVHRLLALRAAGLTDEAWLGPTLAALEEGDVRAARRRSEEARHPAARVIAAALKVWPRRPDRATAEAARVGSLELQRLEKHLGLLSFIAQVAPLLGLLGTAVGMVELFYDLDRAGATDVSALSSGIWTALLTTAAGLAVAVAALAAHGYVAARTDALRLFLHDAVERALTALPSPDRSTRGDATREL